MKRLVLMIIPALICIMIFWVASSCNKESNANDDENSDCMKIIQNSPETINLSKSEMDVIKNLFNRNQLDYKKYQFFRLQKDELGYHHVRCYQFLDNLRYFNDYLIFHFDKNDSYYYLSGRLLINTINMDSKPSMNQDDVVEKFINTLLQDNNIGYKEDIINGCFEIEFGCLDLSYPDENFVKAWRINPTESFYPFAYIIDETSEIYYDNGIRH